MTAESDPRLAELLTEARDDAERRRLAQAWHDLAALAREDAPEGLTRRFRALVAALESLPGAAGPRRGARRLLPAAAVLLLGLGAGAWLARLPARPLEGGATHATRLLDPTATAVARLAALEAAVSAPGGWSDRQALLVDRLLRDPSVNVRLAAARALAEAPGSLPSLPLRRALEADPSPLVQLALIDLLAAQPMPGGEAWLRQLADDPGRDPIVKERALRALRRLRAPALT